MSPNYRFWKPEQHTSMYRFPMWCLCLCSARSLCSSLTNLTKASPFLLPWALRQSAAPPLRKSDSKQVGVSQTTHKLLREPAHGRKQTSLGSCHSHLKKKKTAGIGFTPMETAVQVFPFWNNHTDSSVGIQVLFSLCLVPALRKVVWTSIPRIACILKVHARIVFGSWPILLLLRQPGNFNSLFFLKAR